LKKVIEVIEFIVKYLVDFPDKVKIIEKKDDNFIILEIRVDSKDIGKIIGRQGRVIKAIRKIVKASTIKNNRKIGIEIIE